MPLDLTASDSIINAYLSGLQIRRQKEQFEQQQGLREEEAERRGEESKKRLELEERRLDISRATQKFNTLMQLPGYLQAAQQGYFPGETVPTEEPQTIQSMQELGYDPTAAEQTYFGEQEMEVPLPEQFQAAGTPETMRIPSELAQAIKTIGLQTRAGRAAGDVSAETAGKIKGAEFPYLMAAERQKALTAMAKFEAEENKRQTGKEKLARFSADKSWERLQASIAGREKVAGIRTAATKAMPEGIEAVYKLSVSGNIKSIPSKLAPHVYTLHAQRGTVPLDPKYKQEIIKYSTGITQYLNAYEKFVNKWKDWFKANDVPLVGRGRRVLKTLEAATVAKVTPPPFNADLKMLSGMLLQAHKAFSGETASRISDQDRVYAEQSFMPLPMYGWRDVKERLQAQKDFFNGKIWGDLIGYGLEKNQLRDFSGRIQSKHLVVPKDLKDKEPFIGPRENIRDMGWEEGKDYEVLP